MDSKITIINTRESVVYFSAVIKSPRVSPRDILMSLSDTDRPKR